MSDPDMIVEIREGEETRAERFSGEHTVARALTVVAMHLNAGRKVTINRCGVEGAVLVEDQEQPLMAQIAPVNYGSCGSLVVFGLGTDGRLYTWARKAKRWEEGFNL